MKAREKPDEKQCQADIQVGTFMTMGGVRHWERCNNTPIAILKEKKPGKDGQRGSMSLCGDCLAKFGELDNRQVTIKFIKR